MTTQQIEDIYIDIKAGRDIFNDGSLDKYPIIIHYYLVKAHKLVNEPSFFVYWESGINKDPLIKVLSSLYHHEDEDALQYCHIANEGLSKLDKYIDVAKTVL